jgi:hypothetical protein
MTPRRLAAPVALAAALLAAGCGTVNALKVKAPDPGTREGDWAGQRNLATRRFVLYDRFEHRATLTVTYLSPAVRDARAKRLADWLGWTPEELSRSLLAEEAEGARYDDFLVALYTADRRANDLDSRKSIWRLALRLDDGKERVTHDVTVVDPDATVRSLFPYIGAFDNVYRVRFDRGAAAPLAEGRFTLEVASALGKIELRFGGGEIGPDRPVESLPDRW